MRSIVGIEMQLVTYTRITVSADALSKCESKCETCYQGYLCDSLATCQEVGQMLGHYIGMVSFPHHGI